MNFKKIFFRNDEAFGKTFEKFRVFHLSEKLKYFVFKNIEEEKNQQKKMYFSKIHSIVLNLYKI